MLDRARRCFPEPGLPYQLFDTCVLLFGLAFFWYVGSPPSTVTMSTVGDVFALLLSPRGWGYGIMASAVLGAVAAYASRWRWWALLWGYLLVSATAGAWAMALLAGVVLADPGRDLAYKALGSALLFAWTARGLVAAVMAADDLRGVSAGR